RRGGGRDGVRRTGTGAAFRAQRAQQGLHPRAGNRHLLRGAYHPAEPARRPAVWLPRSADSRRMNAVPAAAADVAHRFGHGRLVRVPAALLLLVLAAALLGPPLSPHDYFTMDLSGRLEAPALEDARLFGTDDLGRDLFVRTMSGARVTLLVAVVACLVSLGIGVAYGAVAGGRKSVV